METRIRAKDAAVKHYVKSSYPDKAYSVEVLEAKEADGGRIRVKSRIDGEDRVGFYDPAQETFDEGYYSLAYERGKKIAELEKEVIYWKEKSQDLEKELFKTKTKCEKNESSH